MATAPIRFSNVATGGNTPYGPNSNDVNGGTRTLENVIDGAYERIPLPFRDGDSITFQITFKPAALQSDLTGIGPNGTATLTQADMERIYNIRFNLVDAAIANTTPDDDATNSNTSYVA